MASSECFGETQAAPALLCPYGHRDCGSSLGWRFYLGHGICQPPPAAILGEFISSLFKFLFLFSATNCGGENRSETSPRVESEVLGGFESNDLCGCSLSLRLGEAVSDQPQFSDMMSPACRHPGCDFFEVQASL